LIEQLSLELLLGRTKICLYITQGIQIVVRKSLHICLELE
jgi:hypothetical protein